MTCASADSSPYARVFVGPRGANECNCLGRAGSIGGNRFPRNSWGHSLSGRLVVSAPAQLIDCPLIASRNPSARVGQLEVWRDRPRWVFPLAGPFRRPFRP